MRLTTHLAYKPEHASISTPASCRRADPSADEATRRRSRRRSALRAISTRRTGAERVEPCVLVADKGYHAREQLRRWMAACVDAHRRTLAGQCYLRWHSDEAAQRAVYANRPVEIRIWRETLRRRGELVERSFAHVLDRSHPKPWRGGRRPRTETSDRQPQAPVSPHAVPCVDAPYGRFIDCGPGVILCRREPGPSQAFAAPGAGNP